MPYPKTCLRCKDKPPLFGKWEAKKDNPRYCPLCKSPFWNVPVRDQLKSEGAKKPRVEKQEEKEVTNEVTL